MLFESKDSIRGLPNKQENKKETKQTAHHCQVEGSQTIVQTWIKIIKNFLLFVNTFSRRKFPPRFKSYRWYRRVVAPWKLFFSSRQIKPFPTTRNFKKFTFFFEELKYQKKGVQTCAYDNRVKFLLCVTCCFLDVLFGI